MKNRRHQLETDDKRRFRVFFENFRQNLRILKTNKRHLRADVLSLLSSALRPRLLNNRGGFGLNVVKIVVMTTILGVFGLFSMNFAIPVSAASLTLSVPTDALKLDLQPDNTFAKSSSGSVSVKTDAFAGYTLSIKAKSSNDLVNGGNKISSITGNLTEDQYKASGNTNTWGYQPSKINGSANVSFLPGPSTSPSTIEKTSAKNDTANNYNIILGAKIDSTLPNGTYANTFVFTATANTVSYRITYNLNDGVWDGTSPQTGDTAESTVTLDSHAPSRTNYAFEGWCTVSPTNNSTTNPSCSGQTYTVGQSYTLANGSNNVNLYAIWKQNSRSYTINYHSNVGSPNNMPGTQTGVALPNSYSILLSSNIPTLSNYVFTGWCTSSTNNATCSGRSYNAGASIIISSNGQVIDLYAKWRTPAYGDDCQGGKGKILKDGKCWMKVDVATSIQWAQAASYCTTPWHLPSSTEFNTLIKTYFPSAWSNSAGSGYEGDTSVFAADWGTTSGQWWSSSTTNDGYANRLFLSSSEIRCGCPYDNLTKRQIRCVSN